MRYEELSIQAKRRIEKSKCLICGCSFFSYDDVEYLKVRNGRYIKYAFFHLRCLANQLGIEKGGEVIGSSQAE